MLKTLIERRSILSRVRQIAEQICESDADTLCPVLNGTLPFFNDLMSSMPSTRAWKIKPIVAISRTPSGEKISYKESPLIYLHPDLAPSDKIWIIVDIIDSGSTIWQIKTHLQEFGITSQRIAVLLKRKRVDKQVLTIPDQLGFETDNSGWLVGYGMSWMDMYRSEPNISVLIKPQEGTPQI